MAILFFVVLASGTAAFVAHQKDKLHRCPVCREQVYGKNHAMKHLIG